ncbi:hypothetical protein [Picrophilus oshimae]|uniref:Uncharacterized protein n=1 Tax=Picrophilus torridus (strain ATCC 700027 / DSM 9790 / JCM 10055 / NBRC 100828 / KAW 2/3) TaxID=1122961 RepID=A0A8G2L8H1_PICTO|nr:hypothetical protein [Picrophilus oshimae]SMD31454.1 hypothetical protein SAMN02745355_1395 [Picrophilus oshimae DSM 9789]
MIVIFSFEAGIELKFDDIEKDDGLKQKKFKDGSELIELYHQEKPIEFNVNGKLDKIPASVIWEFNQGEDLESFETVKVNNQFKMPDEFLNARNRVMNLYTEYSRKEFSPYDKICIYRLCESRTEGNESRYVFYVSKADLVDEYTVIQNPDVSTVWISPDRSVTPRELIYRHGKFPSIQKFEKDGELCEIPYRIAMHIIIET